MNTKDYASKLLSEVLSTIANLKDVHGSPPQKIIDSVISTKKVPIKSADFLIKKTLRNGVRAGLIKEVDGKYKLGLARREYSTLRQFHRRDRVDPVRKVAGRRKRQRKRRKSRATRRKRSLYTLKVDDPDDKSARRRRKRKIIKRKRRRSKSKRRSLSTGIRRVDGPKNLEDLIYVNESMPNASQSNKPPSEDEDIVRKCSDQCLSDAAEENSDHCLFDDDDHLDKNEIPNIDHSKYDESNYS